MAEAEGPTCLYKNGDAHVFDAEEVADAVGDGWVDTPAKAARANAAEDAKKAAEAKHEAAAKARQKAEAKAKKKAEEAAG